MNFFEKWDKLENLKGKVILKHSLFGRQMHNCDALHTINDSRVGLVLKGQEVYMDKVKVSHAEINDNMYTVSDGRLTITVIC